MNKQDKYEIQENLSCRRRSFSYNDKGRRKKQETRTENNKKNQNNERKLQTWISTSEWRAIIESTEGSKGEKNPKETNKSKKNTKKSYDRFLPMNQAYTYKGGKKPFILCSQADSYPTIRSESRFVFTMVEEKNSLIGFRSADCKNTSTFSPSSSKEKRRNAKCSKEIFG